MDFYTRHPNDTRLKKKFASSTRKKERIRRSLHRTAKKIVERAKANNQAIVLERLTGIRIAHRKENGEGNGIGRRITQWPFRALRAFVLYEARWEAVSVEFVSAAYTSQTCHDCHYVNRELRSTERGWQSPDCGAILDRDLNAAINIERRGKIPCLGEVRPRVRGTDEAVRGNEQEKAPILRAEPLKLR
jgi:IS605 OrfB family transposase